MTTSCTAASSSPAMNDRLTAATLLFLTFFAACASHRPQVAAPLLEGVGRVSMPITTRSTQSQVYFNQGMALLYGYWWFEARRSFEAAVELDSTCAMCHWGLFQSLSEGSGRARAALNNAKRLSHLTSVREQHFIRADALYDSIDTYADAHEAFISEMESLLEAYPDDLNAQLFLIHFLMEDHDPDDPSPDPRHNPEPMLQRLMEQHPDHLGVHHYWIHAVEAGSHPEVAMESARKLAALAPRAVHMPGHVYYRTGDYRRSHDNFVQAFSVDSTYQADYGIPPHRNWNFIHNLNYLVANCGEDGRYSEGMRWARHLDRLPIDPDRPLVFYQGRLARARLQLRYGMWEQAANSLQEFTNNDTLAGTFAEQFVDGTLAYARGMAALDRGDLATATAQRKALDGMEWIFMIGPVNTDDGFYSAKRRNTLRAFARELRGMLHAMVGEFDKATEALEEAVDIVSAMGYAEPPEFAGLPAERLGEAHLLAANWKAAESAFRLSLKARPGNGHGLYGLARALAAQNLMEEAMQTYSEFVGTWQHGDRQLPQLQSARTWLESADGG